MVTDASQLGHWTLNPVVVAIQWLRKDSARKGVGTDSRRFMIAGQGGGMQRDFTWVRGPRSDPPAWFALNGKEFALAGDPRTRYIHFILIFLVKSSAQGEAECPPAPCNFVPDRPSR
jgi:hypothetical protein